MSDWKGAALVLQQLAEFRKPSQLDVLEKQYELQALANKTEREYNNKVKTYDALKAQYDGLVNEKKTLINKVGMNADLLPKTNRTEDAVNVIEKLYNQKANDIDLALETVGGEIDFLQQDILNLNNINNAGSYAETVAKSKNVIDNDGNTINLFKQFDNDGSGELDFEEKDAMFRFEAERKFPGEENQYVRDAFIRVGLSETDAEEEAKEKEARTKEIKAEEEEKSPDQLAREKTENTVKAGRNALAQFQREFGEGERYEAFDFEQTFRTDSGTLNMDELKANFGNNPNYQVFEKAYKELLETGDQKLITQHLSFLDDKVFEDIDTSRAFSLSEKMEAPQYVKDGYDKKTYDKIMQVPDENNKISPLIYHDPKNNYKPNPDEVLDEKDRILIKTQFEWLVKNYNTDKDKITINVQGKRVTVERRIKEIKMLLKSAGIGLKN